MKQFSTRIRVDGARLLAASLLLAVACSPAPAASPRSAAPASPATSTSQATKPAAASPAASSQAIRIGVPVNVTGPQALLGIPIRDGIQMAADEINEKGGIGGRKIDLLIEDAGATNDSASSAVRKLLSEKPLAMIGLPLSNHVIASLPSLKEAQIPTIVMGTNPTIGPTGKPWVYQILVNNDIGVRAAATYVVERLGKTKVAIIHSNDENGTSADKAVLAVLQAHGLKPAADESFELSDKDVTAQLLKIKSSGADSVVAWADQAGNALIIRQAKQLGLDIPKMNSTLVAATLNLLTADELDGNYSAYKALPNLDTDPLVRAWAENYKKRYNRDADEYAAVGYDAMKIVAQAIEKGNTTSDAITKYLSTLKDYQGVCCPHTADANDQLSHHMVIARYKGKTPEVIEKVSG